MQCIIHTYIHTYIHTFYSPVEVPAPSITHSTLLSGNESNLTCNYFSLDSIPHEANATWRLNGNKLTQNDRVLIEGATLSFSPLNTSDSGRYSCELSIISLTSHVIIQGPPRKSNELLISVKSKLLLHLYLCTLIVLMSNLV